MLVATMLSGNNAAIWPRIQAAIRSVLPVIDRFVLIDTGISDGTDAMVMTSVTVPCRVVQFDWVDDFAAARNYALRAAADVGGDWVVTIDTDEELHCDCDKETLAARLDSQAVDVWLVSHRDGTYAKERFIRLPPRVQWVGAVHEAIPVSQGSMRDLIAGVTFSEAGKSPEQMQHKLQRDVRILHAVADTSPRDARAWYYLGQTHEQLGAITDAVQAYYKCLYLPGQWAEQAAWAAFKAACILCRGQRWHDVINTCMLGIGKQYASPELFWLVAYCHYRLGDDMAAVFWAELATKIGAMGMDLGRTRISFRYLPGWYDAPWDVLRHAYLRMGQPDKALNAAAECGRAKQLRETRFGAR